MSAFMTRPLALSLFALCLYAPHGVADEGAAPEQVEGPVEGGEVTEAAEPVEPVTEATTESAEAKSSQPPAGEAPIQAAPAVDDGVENAGADGDSAAKPLASDSGAPSAPEAAPKDAPPGDAPEAAAKPTTEPAQAPPPKAAQPQAAPPPKKPKDTSVKTFLRGLRPDFSGEIERSAWGIG